MSCLTRSLVLCALLATLAPLRAQIHEETPVDLSKGMVFRADSAAPGATLGEAAQTRVVQQSFAASAVVNFSDPLADTALLGQGDVTQGWSLRVTPDGALRFEARTKGKADPITVATPDGVIAPGTTHHVAINILRDATKPNAGIWVDGVELTSGVVPPANLSAPQPFSAGIAAKHVRLYHRDLTRAEVLALQLEALTDGKPKQKHPAPPANGPRFIPQQDETIALIGGTEAVALAEAGELEALLLLAFPQTRFHFRSLAWEGDTVFSQDRPMNFGDLPQQLRRANAGAVFIMFGRQECLDRGKEGLEEFKEAYGKLLDAVANVTPNIVIIGPVGFEKKRPPLPDLSSKNEDVKAYNAALGDLAASRGFVFANGEAWIDPDGLDLDALDLSGFDDGKPKPKIFIPQSTDGVHLTNVGCASHAESIFGSLSPFGGGWYGDKNTPQPWAVNSNVRTALAAKNRLWHDYWRPSNWAFLHGDRTQQPSSRDPVNPQLRFFPAEQEKYLPLLKEAEEKVYRLVQEATKKLP